MNQYHKQDIIRLIRLAWRQNLLHAARHQKNAAAAYIACHGSTMLAGGVSQNHRPLTCNTEFNTYECRISHYTAGMNYDVVAAIDPNDPTAIIVTVIDTEE